MGGKLFVEKKTEDQIVAVIMAAIAAYNREKGKVTIIRRISSSNVPLWSLSGRQELMENKFF
ncbi:MAG: hypothetical protein WAO24_02530 [Peptococcia bacterium]